MTPEPPIALIPTKSLVQRNLWKLIPAKSLVKFNLRKSIPAKCKKNRKNQFPQKFLILELFFSTFVAQRIIWTPSINKVKANAKLIPAKSLHSRTYL